MISEILIRVQLRLKSLIVKPAYIIENQWKTNGFLFD